MSFMDFISNLFGGFGGASSCDLAIDLGTANTLVAVTGQGVVLNEPSVVAIERSTHRVLAVGHEAKQMINHTPMPAEHPCVTVVADHDVTEAMLSAFITKR
ncbi:MAG: rod shape-determining protein [Eggerthellaceae bacterium]